MERRNTSKRSEQPTKRSEQTASRLRSESSRPASQSTRKRSSKREESISANDCPRATSPQYSRNLDRLKPTQSAVIDKGPAKELIACQSPTDVDDHVPRKRRASSGSRQRNIKRLSRPKHIRSPNRTAVDININMLDRRPKSRELEKSLQREAREPRELRSGFDSRKLSMNHTEN